MLNRLRSLLNVPHKTDSRPANSGITFTVDDVVPAADPFWVSNLADSLERRAAGSILIMPDRDLPALAAEGYSFNDRVPPPVAGGPAIPPPPVPLRSLLRNFSPKVQAAMVQIPKVGLLHPFMEAVHLAFSQHRPLVLSPDAIWLTIAQGFGHHVRENAEALRHQIVRHEGKKTLTVVTDSLHPDRWPDLIAQFSAAIQANSDPVLYETLTCDFSTTTPSIRTSSEIALMDVYQCYFEYGMMCVCGIPKVTLQGTPSDWQRIRERVEVLRTYDLDWWISRLVPILDEFVATANGRPNREFWKAIYKPREAYATTMATGWITDLFPYLGDKASRPRNHMLAEPRKDWIIPQKGNSFLGGKGVSLDSFPSGLSRAPVKVELPNKTTLELDLLGGFFGVGQRPKDNALTPIISWAVANRAPEAIPPVPSHRRSRFAPGVPSPEEKPISN
jgi:hypothetical protein